MNAAETWVDIRSTNADKSMFSNIVDYMKGYYEFIITGHLIPLQSNWVTCR